MSDIEIKLSAARTRLILDKPFLGALVLRLPLEKADPAWCQTTATDARKIFYNETYMQQLDVEQAQFVLAHEALHCALSHFARRQNRDQHRWDVACDYAINTLLLDEDLKPPPGILADDGFKGMTAEEIYPSIEENCHEQPLDQHVYDESAKGDQNQGEPQKRSDPSPGQSGQSSEQYSARQAEPRQAEPRQAEPRQAEPRQADSQSKGAARPQPLSATQRDNLKVQWQQRLAGAAQQAMQAGKLGGAMARLVDHLLEPQLPWRHLLAHYVSSLARDDYNYSRPSNRRGDPAVYPSLRSSQINLAVALDTSGSISDKEMSEFLSEINAIKSQVRARVVLLACDTQLSPDGPWLFEPWEEFALPGQFKGGGGTSFVPVFQWLEQQDMPSDLLVYFTDGDGEFPDVPSAIPVLWLIKGKNKVPWGQRLQLN